MTTLTRRTIGLVGGFLGWTIFVWGIVRVRNILGDDALSTASRNKALLLSATFWVPAVVLLVGAGFALVSRSSLARWVRGGLLGVAVWSVLVWLVRATEIALNSDRGVAFIVVHVVLGVISIALAALVSVEMRQLATIEAAEGQITSTH